MATLAGLAAVASGIGLGLVLTTDQPAVAAAAPAPGDPPPATPQTTATPRADAPTPPVTTASSTVNLQVQISGLSASGCVIEVRPGHPGCKFKPLARKVDGHSGGETVQLNAIPIQVTTAGADRDCSFAITLREPGGPSRTFRRGLRLNSPPTDGQPAAPQVFPIFLSSPSLAARLDSQSTLRR
jgi:hypothetical protein